MVVTFLIVGAGQRGKTYAQYCFENPDKAKVVAVAEPRDWDRNYMQKHHTIADDKVFKDWKEAAAQPRLADAVVIATLDRMHLEPALAFAAKGYHILLEKPMAVKEEDCRSIVEAVKKEGKVFAVGHVMRYSPLSTCLKEILDRGDIGEILNVQHLEPVGFWHAAHSYVRGNWRREDEATFMLMAKSCHDIDWISWVVGKKCTGISSFGAQSHFKKEKKPQGAADRCVDCGVESSCPYSAKKVYLDRVKNGDKKWPVSVITPEPDIESVLEAIKTGPYGRCVYACDNDVVDNQVVNLEFADGVTASFSMVSFTHRICERQTRIFGSRGELNTDSDTIEVYDFVTGKKTVYSPYLDDKYRAPANTELIGHGGGDWHLARKFVEAVAANDQNKVLSGPDDTLETHLMTFAAERARKNRTVESIKL